MRSGPRQLTQLLGWAAGFECRTWAVESASGLGYLLSQQLLACGERVVDVPATLSSRVRLPGSGRSNKNDANDARAVAVAALRAVSLPLVRIEDHVSVLRLLAKAQFAGNLQRPGRTSLGTCSARADVALMTAVPRHVSELCGQISGPPTSETPARWRYRCTSPSPAEMASGGKSTHTDGQVLLAIDTETVAFSATTTRTPSRPIRRPAP